MAISIEGIVKRVRNLVERAVYAAKQDKDAHPGKCQGDHVWTHWFSLPTGILHRLQSRTKKRDCMAKLD
jgi:hypothetical protein